MEGQQPGQTIAPQSPDDRQAHESQTQTDAAEPVVQPVTPSEDHEVTPMPPSPQAPFESEDTAMPPPAPATTDQSVPTHSKGDFISWTASEYVEHSKDVRWYISLGLATVVFAALIFITTRDKIATSVIIVAALAFGIFAARKPRVLEYRLDAAGLTIGAKAYAYEQFKSFSIVDEGNVPSIYLMPMQRFMPALTLYYAHQDEDKIVDILSKRLPIEERQLDTVDRFMHRIRF